MIYLNLLPPERKQLAAGRRRNRRIIFWSTMVIILFVLATGGLFATTIYTSTIVASQKSRIEETRTDLQRYTDIESLILSLRDRVDALSANEKSRLLWSKVLADIALAVPEGIQFTQLSFATANAPHVQIGGKAVNKEKVASLQERLEASDRFEMVNIRQIGQSVEEDETVVTTFNMEANITGVAPPKQEKKAKPQEEEKTQ